MKFGVVHKSATLNRFVLQTLQRNSRHLAVITRKTRYFERGNWKRATIFNFSTVSCGIMAECVMLRSKV